VIKILIVEDQALLRDSLECDINSQNDMEVVGVTNDASKAPELCRKLKPDLVLMDVVTENGANGINFAVRIRQEQPEIKIVIKTSLPEITFAEKAKKAGVFSYINKNASNKNMLHTIRDTMKRY